MDHADLSKTRRSLWIANLFTLAIANATFESNTLDFFGLLVAVEQSDLVALGRLAITVLLIIFVMHSFVLFLDWLSHRGEEDLVRFDKSYEASVTNYKETNTDPGWPHQDPPWAVEYSEKREIRQKRLDKIIWRNAVLRLAVDFAVKYAFVLVVSIMALFFTSSLRRALIFFSI